MRRGIIKHPEEIRGVLLISLTGIGNTIFFTPVVRNVRKIFPNATIYFLGTPATIAVVSGCPYVDELIMYEKEKMATLRRQLQFIKQLRKRQIDVTICAFSERSSIKFSLLSLLSGAKIRAGVNEKGKGVFFTHQTRPVHDRHEVEQNLDILRTLTDRPLSSDIFFWVTGEDKQFAGKWIASAGIDTSCLIIGLHPGSAAGNPHKRWPVENYSRLTQWLFEKYRANIIIFGGAEERKLADQVADSVSTAKIAAGEMTLKQTAAVLDRVDLFIGHDSGVMHMAAAREIPVIAMFGPTSPQMYAPPGNRQSMVISRHPGMDAMQKIPVEEVAALVEKMIQSITPKGVE